MTDSTPTPEVVSTPAGDIVHQGRREEDWVMRLNALNDGLFEVERSIFFWVFGMFLDHDDKPSMSRIMLALWTLLGAKMMYHEMGIDAHNGVIALNNAVWTAWWAAEAALSAAVFAPATWGDTMKTIGSAAATSIGTAAREAMVQRSKAAAVGEPGTQYDK